MAVTRIQQREPLRDGHGRLIGDVRVSVTDRCNFRCQYCMPAEGLPWLERDEILRFEEIARLVGLLASMGVVDVRLTGGEPLVRRELPRLVAMLSATDGLRDLSVTTNGYLLERDAEALVRAGVRRFNVSVDSLQRDRFFEFMPLDADHAWSPDAVLTGEEIRAAIHAVFPLEPEPREPSATARVFRFADGRGRIGFVNPVSEPFCGDCNRIRLTADGRLRTCLFSLRETDLRAPLRSGASDDELEAILRAAVWRKELKHRVGDPGFVQPARTMSAIGG